MPAEDDLGFPAEGVRRLCASDAYSLTSIHPKAVWILIIHLGAYTMEQTTLHDQIEEVINAQIRPFIESDGGQIRFVELKDSVVYVELSGACGTCPSATMTLKGGVEAILKRRFPEIHSVELAKFGTTFSY
jgi:Fe-S cluster biogenesis protein NfuA